MTRQPDFADLVALANTMSQIDTGMGMSPDQLSNLFKRFVQADQSTTRRYGGTGLGLSITRAFVELLGGEVDVASEEGRGSTFTIRVPAEHAELPTDMIDAEPAPAVADSVLVIDDAADTRALLARFLQRDGFVVREASDGRTGLTLAKSFRPRVVLLDVMMPPQGPGPLGHAGHHDLVRP